MTDAVPPQVALVAPAVPPAEGTAPTPADATTDQQQNTPNATPPEGILDKAVGVLSDIKNFVTSPSEVGKAVVKGTRDAADEAIQSTGSLLQSKVEAPSVDEFGRVTDPGLPPDGSSTPHLPEVEGPKTGTGKFVASTVQFVEGMATLGKVLGPLKYASGLARTGEMAARSGADFAMFFDPYADRLSNMVQQYPSLANPVADFLAANPDDPEVVARFKNGLENAGLGVALDGFLQGTVAVARYLRGNTQGAVEAAQAAGTAHEAATAAEAAKPAEAATAPARKEAPIVQYRRDAAAITDQAPDLAEGYTRLWRGNRPGEVGSNPQFTNDLPGIALPFRKAYGGGLSYVDVPTADLDKFLNKGAAADNAEFILPKELAANAKVVDHLGSGEAPPGAPRNPDETGQGATPLNANVPEGSTVVPVKPEADLKYTPEEVSATADSLLKTDPAPGANGIDPDVSPINLNYVRNPEARQALLTELGARINEARIARGEPEVISHSETLASGRTLAQQMGMSPDEAFQWAAETVGNVKDAASFVPAMKIYVGSVEKAIRQHAQWYREGRLGPYGSEAEFNQAVDDLTKHFMEFGTLSQDLGTAAGRLLNAHQITTGDSAAITEAVSKAAMGGTPDAAAARQLMLERIAAAPEGIEPTAQIVRPFLAGAQKMASYYINSLLGYTTVVVKGTSDLLKGGLIQPTEQAYRGIYRGVSSGDWTQFTQAGGQVLGMVHTIFDTLKFGGRSAYGFSKDAFVTGKQYLDPTGHGLVHDGNSGGNLGEAGLGLMDAVERGDYSYALSASVGQVVQAPTRLINTLHEFSQQVIYRGRVYGKANTEATLQGLSGADRDTFVQQAMRDAFDANGGATDNEALNYARAGTYSSQLAPTDASGHMQNFLLEHPLGRVVLPFVKAPANLLYDVYQYTPVAKPVVDGMRSVIAGGGPQAEEQVARLLTGATLWGGALTLAYNGMLTDGGSQDKSAKQEQEETGWKPHSLVLSDPDGTKHYYPIDRIDPLGQVLAMAADLHTLHGLVGKEDFERIAMHAVVAISHDTLSKNYLKTAGDLITALGESNNDADAETKWQKVLKGVAGGLVPTQLARSTEDPLMRDTKGLIEAMKARTPGLSQTLDRRYNTLGETVVRTPALGPDLVSPFFHSVDTADDTQAALSHIANTNPQGFRPPPKTMRYDRSNGPGVDLSSLPGSNGHSAYDRYQELIGDLGDGSPTFREQLTETMNKNPTFWKSPAPDGTSDIQGLRYKELNAILAGRREAAKGKLISENPQLKAALDKDVQDGLSVLQHGGGVPLPTLVPGQKRRP